MKSRKYYTYILTNRHCTVLYIGMTGDLVRRIWQHRQKKVKGFTRRYNVNRLIYFEEYGRVERAIDREKQLKGWSRPKKEALIEKLNPEWRDLYEEIL